MTHPTSPIRPVGPDDQQAVADVLAEAFLHGDLAPWLIPHLEHRARAYPGYFHMITEHAVVHGHVEVVDVDGVLPAVAVWYPHDATPPPGIDAYERRLSLIVGQALPRFLALDTAMHTHHPHDEAHHYLALLAVHPDHQGAGLGSALLRHHHHRLDAAGTPAYLEATGRRNRALYARHGYLSRPAYPVVARGPLLYPMWRPPRQTHTTRSAADTLTAERVTP